MNIQTNPFELIAEALAEKLKELEPRLVTAEIGWPDIKYTGVDSNLPSVFFVEISENGRNVTSRLKVHKTIDNEDGTGKIVTEQKRLFKLIQISLFTSSKEDRSSIGWAIKQYLVTNYRLLLSDGEYAQFTLKGEHDNPGESNFYQRDLTFEVTARVLDAKDGIKVTNINKTSTFE